MSVLSRVAASTTPTLPGGGPAVPGTPLRSLTARRAVRWALLANLVAEVGIVVTGGLVRLTGSGLGCPTWPQCVPGSYTPVVHQAQGFHKYIEFGNRTLTSVVGILAIGALLAVVLHVRQARAGGATGSSRDLLLLAAAPLVGVFAQAVLGGVTVLTSLNPATVAAHFLLSMVLITASTALYLAVRGPRPAAPRVEVRWLTAAVAVVAAVVLALGTVVTGSGPHSGDADAPARFGFDPRTVSWLHADMVWLFIGLVGATWLTARLTDAPRVLGRRTAWLAGVTLLQGVIGYVQYATDLPSALVALHMLGASVLVIAVTSVVHAAGPVSERGAGSTA